MPLEPEDIAKAVQSVGGGVAEGSKMISRLLRFYDKIMGEPLREVAGVYTDTFAVWRLKNRLKLVEEVERLIDRWGIKAVRAVTPKLALPIIEAASLEDDDDLRSRYACLLANFCDPDSDIELRPAYKQMLDGMVSRDLVVLQAMYDEAQRVINDGLNPPYIRTIAYTDITDAAIAKQLGIESVKEVLSSLDNLIRLFCVYQPGIGFDGQSSRSLQALNFTHTKYHVTMLGESFLLACDPDLRIDGS